MISVAITITASTAPVTMIADPLGWVPYRAVQPVSGPGARVTESGWPGCSRAMKGVSLPRTESPHGEEGKAVPGNGRGRGDGKQERPLFGDPDQATIQDIVERAPAAGMMGRARRGAGPVV
jgi:hypothetical protein